MLDEKKEQVLVNASYGLAALVDAVILDLPPSTQNLIADALNRGGNLSVVCMMIPRPDFKLILLVPPHGEPVEIARLSPSSESLQPVAEVTH